MEPQPQEHTDEHRTRAAVFLDRDDTINANATLPPEAFPGTHGDLYLPDYVELLPGAREACHRIKAAGFVLVIVTNQGGVARGHATEDDIHATNRRLCELLGEGIVDGCYSAPHHPKAVVDAYRDNHPWRKPNPGMVETAAMELHLDLNRSWLVGDKDRDLEAGTQAGIPSDRCLLVHPERGYPDLSSATDHILSVQPDAGNEVVADPYPQDTLHRTPGPGPRSTATLTAQFGAPLAQPDVRRTVEASAHAIAERTGVALLGLELTDDSVRATLETTRLGAIAFLAELRRTTNAWYHARNGADLWPSA